MKISERFQLGRKLGQGTFSYIYEAYDKNLKQNVALKIEKKDKNKSILIFEYSVLNMLKGLGHVCSAYDFVKNTEQNLIVMDLLGNNLAKVRKCLEDNYSLKIALQLLIEMLDAIEEVHDRGFIHRDVKASNFVLSRDNKQVFIVDFGLAKKHLDDKKAPMAQRKKADFRGTVSFASLNAHNNIDLARRDDLWSLYFVILDFLNEKLKWREQKEYTMDEVKHIKTDCINNPEEKLWIVTKDVPEVKKIFYHLQSLKYEDVPDYELIRQQLKSILERNTEIPASIISNIPSIPPSAYINQSNRLAQGQNIPTLYTIPTPQQNQTFTVYQNPYAPRAIGFSQPQNNPQDFQTPERPSNHHRIIGTNPTAATQYINQHHPNAQQKQQQIGTPQGQDNANSMQEEGAFPKASPHHMININTQGQSAQLQNQMMNCNLQQQQQQQQYFTTSVQQQKAAENAQVYSTTSTSQIRDINQAANSNGLIFNQQIQIGNRVPSSTNLNYQVNNSNGANIISIPQQQDQQEKRRADLKRKAQNTQLEQVVRHEQNQANEGNNQMMYRGNPSSGNTAGVIDLVQNGQAQSLGNSTNNRKSKQVTKQLEKNSKKKDSKKLLQPQFQIIQDEEPLQIKTIIDNANANDAQQNANQNYQQQNLSVPNGLPIFQFSPQNAPNVNQQINNYYLSPQYLLLLNDHPENTQQILQQAALAAQANGQTFPLQSQHPLYSTGIIGQSQQYATNNNPEIIHPNGVVINNQPGTIYKKISATATTAQNFTQSLNQGDNTPHQYKFASAKYQKATLETIAETNKLIKVEQLQENNLVGSAKTNNLIQIMQNTNTNAANIPTNKNNNNNKIIPLSQPQNRGGARNNQNTFYDILSQSNRNQKNSNQAKRNNPPLPPGSNAYYYDPDLIERQKMPCFKIEKASKNLTPQISTTYSTSISTKTNNLSEIQQQYLAQLTNQAKYDQDKQDKILGHQISPLFQINNSNSLLLSGMGFHQNLQQFQQTYQQIPQFIPQQALKNSNI